MSAIFRKRRFLNSEGIDAVGAQSNLQGVGAVLWVENERAILRFISWLRLGVARVDHGNGLQGAAPMPTSGPCRNSASERAPIRTVADVARGWSKFLRFYKFGNRTSGPRIRCRLIACPRPFREARPAISAATGS